MGSLAEKSVGAFRKAPEKMTIKELLSGVNSLQAKMAKQIRSEEQLALCSQRKFNREKNRLDRDVREVVREANRQGFGAEIDCFTPRALDVEAKKQAAQKINDKLAEDRAVRRRSIMLEDKAAGWGIKVSTKRALLIDALKSLARALDKK